MKLTFGDFETNGLFKDGYSDPVSGRYIPPFTPSPQSFAYIQTTENTANVVEAGILYFYNPAVIQHSYEAETIHGLSEEFLSQYRKDFVPNTRKLYQLFFKGNLVGHNMRGFDVKVGRIFLEQMEYGVDIPINTIRDTMYDTIKYYSKIVSEKEGRVVRNKRPKLKALCEALKINDNLIKIMHKKFFGFTPEMSWHNASWDTVATYLCYRIASSNGIME